MAPKWLTVLRWNDHIEIEFRSETHKNYASDQKFRTFFSENISIIIDASNDRRLLFRTLRFAFEHGRPRAAFDRKLGLEAFLIAGEDVDGTNFGFLAVLFEAVVVGPGIAGDLYLAGKRRSRTGDGVVGEVVSFIARGIDGQLLVGAFFVDDGLFAHQVVPLGGPCAIGLRRHGAGGTHRGGSEFAAAFPVADKGGERLGRVRRLRETGDGAGGEQESQ